MGVEFTQDAENKRVASEIKPTWEYLRTTSLVKAVRLARDMGWKEKEVQVKIENGNPPYFLVEPFEKDCSCPHILRYSDYFD